METLFTKHIYTSNGFTKDSVSEKRTLDVGCGGRKLPNSIGMDKLQLHGVDVVHDANVFPWPFTDGHFNLVLANHFLEHVDDVVRTIEEMHRVLVPGGHVVIQVPYFRSTDAFSDPTHQHFFTAQSLNYVIEGTRLSNYAYSQTLFRRLGFWYGWPHESQSLLVRSIKRFMHSHQIFYDQFLSIIFPSKCITWELKKL